MKPPPSIYLKFNDTSRSSQLAIPPQLCSSRRLHHPNPLVRQRPKAAENEAK